MEVLRERMRQVEHRLDINDAFRHEIRESMKGIEIQHAVLRTEVSELRDDITTLSSDVRTDFNNLSKEVKNRFNTAAKIVWILISFIITCTIAVTGLIIQGAAN